MAAQREVLALLERAPDALLAVTPNGEVLFATSALEREFGVTPASVARRPLAELVHPADREGLAGAVRAAADAPGDQPPRTAIIRLGSAGSWRPAVARLGGADLAGGRVAVLSLAPADPVSSPGTFGDLIVDGGEVVTLSPALRAILGDLPERPAATVADVVHPEDVPVVRALLRQEQAVPEPGFGVRLRAVPDGDWLPVRVTAAAGGPGGGRLTVQVEPAPPPHGTVDALPVGVLLLDAGLVAVHRNSRAVALVGKDLGTGWLDCVGPHDRQELEQTLRAVLAGAAPTSTRAGLDDGRVMELRVAPLTVADRGDLLACVVDDVSDVVMAEQEAARLNAIVEASSDLIGTTDPDGRLRWVNPAFRLFLGAWADEPLGLPLADLYSPWARARWEEEALPRLAARGLWSGELALRPIGVAEVPVSQVTVAHRDPHGRVTFLSHVLRDLTARKVHEAGLAHRATHDPLTDLPNRVLLMDRLHTALARARRNGGVVAVLFCDLDDFKTVNDTHGHAVGDRLLLAVANRLSAVLREPDTVARLGGDEFVMLCEGLRSTSEADMIAARVADALAEPVPVGDAIVTPSASVGVAVTVDGDADADTLLRRADRSMYRVKHGKHRPSR